MKIVIVYASAGSGHRFAAQAVRDCLKKDYPQSEVIFIDILDYTSLWFANFYSRGYCFLVAHLNFLWAVAYYVSCFKFLRCFLNFICHLNCSRFINLLVNEQPDVVLVTHFFPAEVVDYLKRKCRINSRLVTVITDFGVHPFWLQKNCDDYIVGLDCTCNYLVNQDIAQDKIKVLGIPIRPGFAPVCQKRTDSRKLTALVATGSFGFSCIEKLVDLLALEIQLLVVCGNNQRLHDRLARKRYTGMRVFGFIEDMPELMSQADLIITKAGGLTIAEALAMEIPMIFIGNIPGQETKNAEILESYGCAINAENLESLRDIIIDLKSRPERLALMRGNICKIKKPGATEELCRYVCTSSI